MTNDYGTPMAEVHRQLKKALSPGKGFSLIDGKPVAPRAGAVVPFRKVQPVTKPRGPSAPPPKPARPMPAAATTKKVAQPAATKIKPSTTYGDALTRAVRRF